MKALEILKVKTRVKQLYAMYISSLDKSAEEFQTIIRNHWAIENKLHWSLDVAFNEDLNRKRDSLCVAKLLINQ